ncbi:GH25 family lysozyme M1 (1,4-beta-N-acetylmuramidase) [Paenibacillus forsythiae]|uniref:Lysozyme n=1 Tax=Paenibacillus forsythiae TaxID=365616 RepID=A0ABU3H1Z1_9BACL|nr:GH25 family lysozyme [Paenibacillus forsythiae]MDT3424840.1 GH25 family lysozyme M1 (1,4-beta-N-acetylmuramidase) [Paenibacillus forsythiae]
MRKISFAAMIFILIILAWSVQTYAAPAATRIILDGHELDLTGDRQVITVHNSIVVPIRVIVEELGFSVDWTRGTNTVTVTQSDRTIRLQIGSSKADVNGQNVSLIAAPIVKNGTTLIPLRFVGEQMGLGVYWDQTDKLITLTRPVSDANGDVPPSGDEVIGNVYEPGETPASAADRYAQGLDVSHHNGQIDWSRVADEGYHFVFIKASEGKKFRDNKFAGNLQGAREAGLLAGAYHFLNAVTPENARLEADNFASAIEEAGGISQLDMPPVMDYENNPGKLAPEEIREVARAFLDELEVLTGCRPMIYTGSYFSSNFDSSFSDYKLWIAKYSSKPPQNIQAWNNWDIWQYTESGAIPGINGNVDLNYYNGSIEELRSSLALP